MEDVIALQEADGDIAVILFTYSYIGVNSPPSYTVLPARVEKATFRESGIFPTEPSSFLLA